MTAIPDATEEDKTVLLKIEQAYEEIEDQIRDYDHYCDGDKIADWRYEQRLIRLLSHYQRENERLKEEIRIRDLSLREKIQIVTSTPFDALTGEGGGA